jgi:mannosyl-oligosaccharide alpha-1,2-mannosidase
VGYLINPYHRSFSFNGWGVTLYDALDTMWIMGLHDMFRDSLETVAKADFYLKPVRVIIRIHVAELELDGILKSWALGRLRTVL